MDVISFDEALALEDQQSRRRVLLGNGFSIACRPDIFTYDALFEMAEFQDLDAPVRRAFDALRTKDFEAVMRGLRTAAALLRVYSGDDATAARLEEDAASLREILVRAIAGGHPPHPFEITPEEYVSARHFLQHFRAIYTVSYDLLLYWTAMQELEPALEFDDGFRTPEEGTAEYVTWEVEKTDSQNVHYLHGALHVFDGGHEIKKYTWINTGVRLIEQIRSAMEADLFPLFVAEGQSEEKLTRINRSNYLSRSYRSLPKIGGALYTFGIAFSDNDAHILRLIKANRKLAKLFVAVFGDPESPPNQEMIQKILGMNAERVEEGGRELLIRFYDARSARVWDRAVA